MKTYKYIIIFEKKSGLSQNILKHISLNLTIL